MSSTTGTVTWQDLILADKLCELGRPCYLLHFRGLRDDNIITPDLKKAVELLYEDAYSLENCVLAVHLASNVLWPHGSWDRRLPNPHQRREFFLRGPGNDVKNDGRRAVILFNEANKNTSPISTATLIGQQGRLEFDLQGPLGLYELFEAALDSELAFERQLRNPSTALPTMDMIHAKAQAKCQLLEEKERRFASLNDVERAWLRRRNYKVQFWTRISVSQTRRPSQERGPPKPFRPSSLQYGLLSVSPIPFYFYTQPMNNFGGFPSHYGGFRWRTTMIMDDLPPCEIDRVVLRYMMTQAMEFLEREKDLLSKDLCALRAKICDFATLTEKQSRGIVASAGLSKEWGPDPGDEIHILCRRDFADSIVIWVLDVGCGRKKWVVKIQRKRLDYLLGVTMPRVGEKRKVDVVEEEVET